MPRAPKDNSGGYDSAASGPTVTGKMSKNIKTADLTKKTDLSRTLAKPRRVAKMPAKPSSAGKAPKDNK